MISSQNMSEIQHKYEEKSMKNIRIWVDGCFDGMHYGHANALRQAKEMGHYLVVGVHSDAEIKANKGPTVFNNTERYAAVAACKWVDLVVQDAPYLTQVEWLDKHDCDFCVHGDDVTTMSDGSDCYAVVKNAGRYKECKRTEGVSTTDLVQRLLDRREDPRGQKPQSDLEFTQKALELFSNHSSPSPGDRVVYVQGSFDMFHSGHADFLKLARQLGDYLVVGILDDENVLKLESSYPILDMRERGLSVLACRYADDIILDCPLIPNNEFMTTNGLNILCNGDLRVRSQFQDAIGSQHELIFLPEQSEKISSRAVIDRILQDYDLYAARNRKKQEKASLEAEMKEKMNV